MKAPEIEKILSQKNVSQVEFGNAGKNLSVETKEKIEKELKLKVTVSDEAIHAVVNGIAVVLDDFEKYKNIIISPSMEY